MTFLDLKLFLMLSLIGLGVVGCAGATQGSSSSVATSAPSAADLAVAHQPEDLSLCLAPENAELSDINSVVDWINAMPKPLTLACFVASLPRPITYNATQSNFSAQPSIGIKNPRIFVKVDALWLSFVPQEGSARIEDAATGIETIIWDADNIQLLELSYEVETSYPQQQTIKGELAFPVLSVLPTNAPYAKVAMNAARTSSICGDCHGNETIVDTLEGIPVFRSTMLRNASKWEVRHNTLVNEYLNCDPSVNTGFTAENNEWYRCQMLDAFYGKGLVLWQSFREDITAFQ